MRSGSRPRVAILGAGAVGGALGGALAAGGCEVAFASRDFAAARRAAAGIRARAFRDPASALAGARFVFLTVPDAAIGPLCARLARARAIPRGSIILHASGFLPSSVLAPARRCGARVASAHPLRAFAGKGRESLAGTLFALEGDPGALPPVRALLRRMRARAVPVRPAEKALYHAAAAIVSNYTVVLAAVAKSLLARALPPSGRARTYEGLLGLLETTLANLRRLGPAEALTGPIARGDLGVVRGHLAALARSAPALLPLYRALGERAVALAEEKGSLSRPSARAARAALRRA